MLVVPLRAFDLGLGAMVFNRPEGPARSRAKQVRFAGSVGSHVAVAVENARLVVELDARQRDLSLVVESSLDFASSLEPRTVIEAVVERLVALLEVSACDIHVLEPGPTRCARSSATITAASTLATSSVGSGRSSDYPTTARVVATGRPVAILSLDDPALERPRAPAAVAERQDQPARCAAQGARPRHRRGRAVRRQAARAYSPEEIELVEAICQFAALALDNAHLYDSQRESAARLERLAAQLETLQQVSLKLGRLRDEPGVVREVLESGAALLEADVAAYAVREGEVVAVKAFYDRDGFSAPDAAAAESIVAVLGDALPEIGATEIGDGVAQQSFADHAFVHGRALIVPLKRDRPDSLAALVFQRSRGRARSTTTTAVWRPPWPPSSRSRCATCTPFSASTRSPRPSRRRCSSSRRCWPAPRSA